jgi:hypothetical protein
MNKLSNVLLFLIFSSNIFAQSYANEWINFNQHYVKITTNSKGIYKITKNDLDILGSELSLANPQKFQLFYRGLQVDILVSGETDGTFDIGDEIHFYGLENDGVMDSELYRPKVRPHPYVSLYSNETAFFLTAGAQNGQRAVEFTYEANSLPITTFYNEEFLKVYENEWIYDPARAPINALNSTYQQNETLISPVFYNKRLLAPTSFPYNENIVLTNYLAGTGKNVDSEVMVANRAGFPNNFNYNFYNNSGSFSLDGIFNNNSMIKKTGSIATIIGNTINLNIASTSTTNNDYWGLFYRKVNFPASFNNVFNRLYLLYPNDVSSTSVIQFTNSASNIVWDVTDPLHVKKLGNEIDGANQKFLILGANIAKNIWVANIFKVPKKLAKVDFENISPNTFDYLLITDTRTIAGAERYKTYRETNIGGNYKVYIGETQKLYDQFAYGERTPIALKRFIAFMSAQIQVKNLFLVGQSVSLPNKLKTKELANLADDEFVPTFGYPASDVQLSTEINGAGEFSASIPTGRLVINSDAEIDQYLAKVKQHEARNNSIWQQNILSITGAKYDVLELSRFNTITNDALNFGLNSSYNISTVPIINYNSTNGTYPNIGISNPSLYSSINNGVGILTYFGHGNITNTQYNFGLVSASTNTGGVIVGGSMYQNQGKNPLLIAMACDVGNAYKGSSTNKTNNSMMTDWVNHPTLGAINALSHTYLGYEGSSGPYFNNLMETLFESNENYFGTAGSLWKKTNLKFGQNSNIASIIFNTIQEQTTLLGDPANRIFYQKCGLIGLEAESNSTGSWANSETWTCGVEPAQSINVKILPGHIVTLTTGSTGYGLTIQLKGKLIVEPGAELKIEN